MRADILAQMVQGKFYDMFTWRSGGYWHHACTDSAASEGDAIFLSRNGLTASRVNEALRPRVS